MFATSRSHLRLNESSKDHHKALAGKLFLHDISAELTYPIPPPISIQFPPLSREVPVSIPVSLLFALLLVLLCSPAQTATTRTTRRASLSARQMCCLHLCSFLRELSSRYLCLSQPASIVTTQINSNNNKTEQKSFFR